MTGVKNCTCKTGTWDTRNSRIRLVIRQSWPVLARPAGGWIGIQLALQIPGGRQIGVELQYLRDGGARFSHFAGGAIEQREIHSHFAPARDAIKRALPKFYGAVGIAGLRFNDAKVERRLVRQRINFQRVEVMLTRLLDAPALLFFVALRCEHACVVRRLQHRFM